MGEFYVFLPLEPDLLGWLAEHSITVPAEFSARHPTPAEVVSAARLLAGYRSRISGPTPLGEWHLEVESEVNTEASPWAFITVRPFTGLAVPSPTVFERGWPEVILPIALSLVEVAGPHVLQPSSGDTPMLLGAGTTLGQARAIWDTW